MTKRRSRTTKPSLDRYRVPARHHPTGHPTAVVLAERSKPPTDERGSAGVVAWGGVLSGFDQDYADAWRLPRRWETTERMRSDPAIAAALSALTYPVLAAKLKVEPASDDPEDVRLAEFVDESLAGMTTSLARHRAEVLGFVGEGVRVFETVYERREDDYWRLRKLALRPNRTITTWHVDDTGGPDGVSQILADGRTEKLEMDRLLAFTHLGDGPSLLGRPATRAMYRPWFVIDKLSRIGAIALERHGVGIPWARYVGGSDTEAKRIDRALMGLHANEQSFFRVDDQVPEWGVKGVEGTVMDPVAFIEYQRRDLFLAPLAQFLALGTDGVGALSLSQDHSSFFMLALRFLVGEIDDTYNAYLVPRMIGYNWSVPADRLPRVQHGAIDQRSATDWATAVAQVVAAGITLPADELTRTAARLLGLTVPEEPRQPTPAVADVNDPNAPEPGTHAGGVPGEGAPGVAGQALHQASGRSITYGVDVCADCGEVITFAGKPCGAGHIAEGKTCRIGSGGGAPSQTVTVKAAKLTAAGRRYFEIGLANANERARDTTEDQYEGARLAVEIDSVRVDVMKVHSAAGDSAGPVTMEVRRISKKARRFIDTGMAEARDTARDRGLDGDRDAEAASRDIVKLWDAIDAAMGSDLSSRGGIIGIDLSDATSYRSINMALRHGREPDERCARIDAAIAEAAPLAVDTVVYRAASFDLYAQPGAEFVDAGYVATVTSREALADVPGGTLVQITVPRGACVLGPKPGEVLLPRGTRFRVTGRGEHGGLGAGAVPFVALEVVP